MVPKRNKWIMLTATGFRAVLFRMVPKPSLVRQIAQASFRAVLFRMVPKQYHRPS